MWILTASLIAIGNITPESHNAMSTTKTISADLAGINGRRRTRTLTDREIMQAALGVFRGDDFVFLHGGHVANAYKFRAYATAALIYRASDGTVRVVIRESSAKKGSTGFGDFLRGDKLLTNIPAGNAVELRDVCEVLFGQAWNDGTPDEAIIDWIEERQTD